MYETRIYEERSAGCGFNLPIFSWPKRLAVRGLWAGCNAGPSPQIAFIPALLTILAVEVVFWLLRFAVSKLAGRKIDIYELQAMRQRTPDTSIWRELSDWLFGLLRDPFFRTWMAAVPLLLLLLIFVGGTAFELHQLPAVIAAAFTFWRMKDSLYLSVGFLLLLHLVWLIWTKSLLTPSSRRLFVLSAVDACFPFVVVREGMSSFDTAFVTPLAT